MFKKLTAPEDRRVSPYTGWTKKHWKEVQSHILKATVRYASPGKAYIKFPGPPSRVQGPLSDWVEGYARTSLYVGPTLYSGDCGRIDLFGEPFDTVAFYREGLLSGTNPQGSEYWGDMQDRNQRLCEAAALAMFIWFSKAHIWDNLSRKEKDQVLAWLSQINLYAVHQCNWTQFKVVVNTVLKHLGESYSEEQMKTYMDIADGFYVGDGWYDDGHRHAFDYYNAYVLHPYFLFWSWLDGESNPSFRDRVQERARCFLKTFSHFFAANGSCPAFGRSMMYRYSVAGIFALAEAMKISPLSPGEARRLASGNVKYFVEAGTIEDDGTHTARYVVPCPQAVDTYSGPGSPYWSGKAFWSFLLPDNHPFWTDKEQPLPVERADYGINLPAPGMLVQGTKKTGEVKLYHMLTALHPGMEKKYGNFCYSSHFACDPGEYFLRHHIEQHIALVEAGGQPTLRHHPDYLCSTPSFGASRHLPYLDDPQTVIESHVILKDDFHVRFHKVKTARKVIIQEGGAALGFDDGKPRVRSGEGWEFCEHDGRWSFVQSLAGYDGGIPAGIDGAREECNILHRFSIAPGMKREGGFDGSIVVGLLIAASDKAADPSDLCRLVREVKINGNTVTVCFHDGERVFTQFMDRLEDVNIELNGKPVRGRVVFARVQPSGKGTVLNDDLVVRELN